LKEGSQLKPVIYKTYPWVSKIDRWSLSRKERTELKDEYQIGNPEPIIKEFILAIFTAIKIANLYLKRIEEIKETWSERITSRKEATIWSVLDMLVMNPIVNVTILQNLLKIEERTAYNVIEQLEEFDIVKKVNQYKRRALYEVREILQLLDELSDIQVLRAC
jgi:Fic family protein